VNAPTVRSWRSKKPDLISVIIPAHNEAVVLPRLLRTLTQDPRGFELLVVCNGSTDATAAAARAFPRVRTLELQTASKHQALLEGLAAARGAWTIFLDADVLISTPDLRRLVEPLRTGEALACGPRRVIDHTDVSWPVRAYYDVWERLPQVQSGLFGRGVIALAPEGVSAFRALPAALSDDLVISESVPPARRRVVDIVSVRILPPRTLRDLVRRRARVATGNAQVDRNRLRSTESQTTMGTLAGLLRQSPSLAGKVVVFLSVTALARLRARHAIRSGDVTTWLRDESSRQG